VVATHWARIGGVILAAGSLGAILSVNFTQLLLARLVQGVGVASVLLALLRILVAAKGSGDVAGWMSRFQSAQLMGILVGPLVGGVVAGAFGLRSTYWLLGIAGLVVACVPGLGLEPLVDPETARPEVKPRKRFHLPPGVRTALLMEFSVFVARAGGQLTLLPLLAVDDLGLSPAMVGIALATSGVAHLSTMPLARRTTTRLDRRLGCALALVGMGVGLFLHSTVTNFVGLLAVSTVVGIASSLAFLLPAVMVSDAPKEGQSVALGLYRACGSLGSVLSPWVMGLLVEIRDVRFAFMICALVLVALGSLFAVLR
jgi:MFS family permease